jgi:GNAT superfamily N-acetyltransferase
MRRLFYRFSDEAIYYRYFTPIKTMPHAKMQAYVNVDYRDVLSVVGLVGPPGQGQIIAEARFARHKDKPYVDVAFVVDEDYQGLGIATYLYRMLARLARQRGARGMTADVLATNQAMIKVFEKGDYPPQPVPVYATIYFKPVRPSDGGVFYAHVLLYGRLAQPYAIIQIVQSGYNPLGKMGYGALFTQLMINN